MLQILLVCGCPGFFSKHTVAVEVHRSGTMAVFIGILRSLVIILSGVLGDRGRDMER